MTAHCFGRSDWLEAWWSGFAFTMDECNVVGILQQERDEDTYFAFVIVGS